MNMHIAGIKACQPVAGVRGSWLSQCPIYASLYIINLISDIRLFSFQRKHSSSQCYSECKQKVPIWSKSDGCFLNVDPVFKVNKMVQNRKIGDCKTVCKKMKCTNSQKQKFWRLFNLLNCKTLFPYEGPSICRHFALLNDRLTVEDEFALTDQLLTFQLRSL